MITGASGFLDLIFTKLNSRGAASDWNAEHLAKALQRAMQGPIPPPSLTPRPIPIDEKSIHNLSDTTMIHEMLRRGYAVMKIPKDGKLKGL